MTKLLALAAMVFGFTELNAQIDSSVVSQKTDTIQIGNMIIIKKVDDKGEQKKIIFDRSKRKYSTKPSNTGTNWFIFDVGFSNYFDKTDYGNAGSYIHNRAGAVPLGRRDFNLNAGKSLNVNLWFFMKRINLVKHVNLKYGLGVELINYRFKNSSNIRFLERNPFANSLQAPTPVVIRDSISFSKNKLGLNYATIPLMLNFVTKPGVSKKGISVSLGVSAGYLYSQRNKQKSDERGKQKNRGDYDLERFKLSYLAELGLGPVRLYGSYSPQSIFSSGLEMKPYTIGIRLSNW